MLSMEISHRRIERCTTSSYAFGIHEHCDGANSDVQRDRFQVESKRRNGMEPWDFHREISSEYHRLRSPDRR